MNIKNQLYILIGIMCLVTSASSSNAASLSKNDPEYWARRVRNLPPGANEFFWWDRHNDRGGFNTTETTESEEVKLVVDFFAAVYGKKKITREQCRKFFTKSSNGKFYGGAMGEVLYYQLGIIDAHLKPLKKVGKYLPIFELLRIHKDQVVPQMEVIKGDVPRLRFLVSSFCSGIAFAPNVIYYKNIPPKDSHYVTIMIFPTSDVWMADQKIRTIILCLVKEDGKYKIYLRDSFVDNVSMLHILGFRAYKNNWYKLNDKMLKALKERLILARGQLLKNK